MKCFAKISIIYKFSTFTWTLKGDKAFSFTSMICMFEHEAFVNVIDL